MSNRRIDEDQLLRDLRIEARDVLEDKISILNSHLARVVLDPVQALRDIRMEAHSIKGVGAGFGFSAVTLVAHRLEDYLSDISTLTDSDQIRDTQIFIDRLQEVIDRYLDAGPDDIAMVVRGLPIKVDSMFDVDSIEQTDIEVMLVAPSGLATRYVKQELMACGYRVITVSRSLEALDFVVHGRPDLVIVSAILPGIDGIDLIRALNAMRHTRDIPLALLTSMDAGDDRLRDLPPRVPVLRKSANFSDDVAKALAQLRII